MHKSQSAVEFVVLASFMLVVIVGFFAVSSSKIIKSKEETNEKIAEDIANMAYREIEIAKSSKDGYTRTFLMPPTVNSVTYSIGITDNRELIINYLNNEFVKFLPADVNGDLKLGYNEIKKVDGIIYVQSLRECDDGEDNDGDSFIDLADTGCVDSFDIDETDCGDTICEGSESCLSCVSDCEICPILQFLIKNNLFNVMKFDSKGNAVLKGSLTQNGNPITTADDEFIVKDSTSSPIAVVNMITGNMVIKGTLQEDQAALTPSDTSDDFVLKNDVGEVISYIDNSGNFYLKKRLTQNGNP